MKKTSLQKFEMVTVHRSQLHEHPKNPRVIADGAKKKLKDKMRQVGLIQPITVNQREDGTMYILGGHQRLGVMDSLENYKDGKMIMSLMLHWYISVNRKSLRCWYF